MQRFSISRWVPERIFGAFSRVFWIGQKLIECFQLSKECLEGLDVLDPQALTTDLGLGYYNDRNPIAQLTKNPVRVNPFYQFWKVSYTLLGYVIQYWASFECQHYYYGIYTTQYTMVYFQVLLKFKYVEKETADFLLNCRCDFKNDAFCRKVAPESSTVLKL